MNKRKNNKRKIEKISDFIVDDDDDNDYIEESKEVLNIRQIIKKKEITKDKVVKSDIDIDDKIWFIEHIDILENMDEYTEERYELKNRIYKKFSELENKKDIRLIKKIRLNNEPNNLLDKINKSNYGDDIKSILYNKYLKMENIDRNDEYFKMNEWLETVLEIPTKTEKIETNIGKQMNNIMENLNKKIYGLEKVKEEIIEAYCAMVTNSEYKKNIIALVGPPGVGKTAIASAVAEAIELPFEHISMGCIKDVNTLVGHSPTYIGARPGLFTELLRKMKKTNGVILLDEIDKIYHASENGSIMSTLVHILDKSQNNKFRDMYMPEINIDLSNIFFILALNDESLLDPVLKDRLHIINIPNYSQQDKKEICTHYLLPKILKELNFKDGEIVICGKVMEYIISKSKTDGIRQLEKIIRKICERINVLKYSNTKMSYSINELKFPFKLTNSYVDMLSKF